jgi:hypothetical protein
LTSEIFMRPDKPLDGMDRRMFVAASAAFLGGIAGRSALAADAKKAEETAKDESKASAGPHAPWPQHTATPPFVNAADFGLKPCFPDKMKVEDFAENPDATDALQKALDAGGNGRVFIPPGAYRVTRPLTIQSGTMLSGAGFCSTMLLTEKAIPAILHAQVSGPMTVISDLWVSGPVGGNWKAVGIWLDNSNGVTVHDCWVGGLETGVRVDGISDTWLRNITFELNQHGITVACPGLGPTAGNVRLFDCYGYQNYQSAITLIQCRGVQMQSCGATGCAYALLAQKCAQLTIQGMQVNHDGSPWHKFGVRLEDCEHLTLSDNVVEGMLDYGIGLSGCKHFTATGNVVRHTTGGPGFLVERCEAGSLNANTISESAQAGLAVSESRNLAILANVIDGFGVGAGAESTLPSKPSQGIQIAGNCENCQSLANVICEKS